MLCFVFCISNNFFSHLMKFKVFFNYLILKRWFTLQWHTPMVITCLILARMDLFIQLSPFSLPFITASRFLHYCCLPAFVIVFLPCEKKNKHSFIFCSQSAVVESSPYYWRLKSPETGHHSVMPEMAMNISIHCPGNKSIYSLSGWKFHT